MVLLGAESHQPYLRPPLSKEYLLGKAGEDALPVVPEDWYDENDVDLRLGVQVTALDPAARAVVLDGGGRLEYGSLLLATGPGPGPSRCPAAGWTGVSTFRTVDDSRRLHARLAGGGQNVVMIGSGWIGMELAAAASTFGNNVTLLGLEDMPLARRSARNWAASSARCTRPTACGSGFRRPLPGSRDGPDGSPAVVTDSGDVLPADLVVIAVGVVPELSPGRGGRASGSATASSPTRRCGPLRPGSSPPATSPTPCTRSPASTTAASTGPMP